MVDFSLDLDQPWSIGEPAFSYISGLIRRSNYRRMLEFGSGVSTVRWALEHPELSVVALDHEHRFLQETQRYVDAFEVGHRVEICHLPLRTVWFNGRRFHSYSTPKATGEFDIVIIDGPPAFTRRGREACLYHIYDKIKLGGLIVLDDFERVDEQSTVSNWLAVYPGSFEYTRVDVGHELAVLKKIRHLQRQKIRLRVMLDNYKVQAQLLRFLLSRRARFR